MLITESKLRKIVREIIEKDKTLNEATTSVKTYTDAAGNKFQIKNGNLMLTARRSGDASGLPIKIPANILSATVRALSSKYPGDTALVSLVNAAPVQPAAAGGSASQVYLDDKNNKFQIRNGKLTLIARSSGKTDGLPITIPANMLAAAARVLSSRYPNDAALSTMAGKTLSNSGAPATPGLTLGNKTKQLYPVTAAEIRSKNDLIHSTAANSDNCSEWAKQFVGFQGNAWIANRTGTLKFNAFSNIGSYQAAASKLFSEMNAAGVNSASSTKRFNPQVKAIVGGLLPSPTSLASSMQIGDVVGMYYADSEHHGEAFFESCSGWSFGGTQVVSACVKDVKSGKQWNNQMLGKKLSFTIVSPFAMNTHLGFVGGMIDGEPIIFHNMTGKVHINLLSKITSAKCYPVWIKQGNYSGTPASGGAVATGANDTGMWDRFKNLF